MEAKAERVKNLGNLIRRLRLQKGWTQGQLAYQAKLKRPWLSRVERGDFTGPRGPAPALLMKVANALGVDPYEFWRTLGYRPADLLRERADEFSPDTVEFALWLETLPPEVRIAAIRGFRALEQYARLAAQEYPEAKGEEEASG